MRDTHVGISRKKLIPARSGATILRASCFEAPRAVSRACGEEARRGAPTMRIAVKLCAGCAQRLTDGAPGGATGFAKPARAFCAEARGRPIARAAQKGPRQPLAPSRRSIPSLEGVKGSGCIPRLQRIGRAERWLIVGAQHTQPVIAGLVPAIPLRRTQSVPDRDGRDEPGRDDDEAEKLNPPAAV
jgi:hypothetical protein